MPSDRDFKLLPVGASPHLVSFDIQMDRETSTWADPSLGPGDPLPTARLVDFDLQEEVVTIFPVVTLPTNRFLRSKYSRIRSISVDMPFAFDDEPKASDIPDYLRTMLPPGFVHDPSYGLGLMKEMRPLISAVETISAVRYLNIRSGITTEIANDTYRLNYDDYEEIRLAFQRIARQYQRESLADRVVLAHNTILHDLDPQTFPLKTRDYQPGTIFKILGGQSARAPTLSGKDRNSVVAAVGANAREIADKIPEEFKQLLAQVELVNLEKLIESFESKLSPKSGEAVWQKLFEKHPFILSMVFGYPVVLVAAGAAAGGIGFSGQGAKIADFLMKHDTSHNAALVEIKTPQTKLLSREYRGGVWNMSNEVTGGVLQVLDQRQKFMTNLATIKHNSGHADIHGYSVDCVLVCGTSPTEPAHNSSFEMFRASLKDVRIITFDELLRKLKLIYELLSTHSQSFAETEVSAIDLKTSADDEWNGL